MVKWAWQVSIFIDIYNVRTLSYTPQKSTRPTEAAAPLLLYSIFMMYTKRERFSFRPYIRLSFVNKIESNAKDSHLLYMAKNEHLHQGF